MPVPARPVISRFLAVSSISARARWNSGLKSIAIGLDFLVIMIRLFRFCRRLSFQAKKFTERTYQLGKKLLFLILLTVIQKDVPVYEFVTNS